MPVKKKDLIKIRDVPNMIWEITGVTRCKETVYLWIKKGVRNYTGDSLKLRTTRRMGHLFTTKEWIEDFIRSM